MVNCPLGSYCPTPEVQLVCPAGYYCPHKTSVPEIVCPRCQEGALKLERDWFGFVVLIIVTASTLPYLIFRLLKRWKRRHTKPRRRGRGDGGMAEFDQHRRRRRRLMTLFASTGNESTSNRQEYIKMKHKVDLINRRLISIQDKAQQEQRRRQRSTTADESSSKDDLRSVADGPPSNRTMNKGNENQVGSSVSAGGGVGSGGGGGGSHTSRLSLFDGSFSIFRSFASFNPSSKTSGATSATSAASRVGGTSRGATDVSESSSKQGTVNVAKVFDTLIETQPIQTMPKGEMSYPELNKILALNDLELGEFKRRMNELAGYDASKDTVSRTKFCKYFLQVLKETSNLTVSYEEAGMLFDEMASDNGGQHDKIHMSVSFGCLADMLVSLRSFVYPTMELNKDCCCLWWLRNVTKPFQSVAEMSI